MSEKSADNRMTIHNDELYMIGFLHFCLLSLLLASITDIDLKVIVMLMNHWKFTKEQLWQNWKGIMCLLFNSEALQQTFLKWDVKQVGLKIFLEWNKFALVMLSSSEFHKFRILWEVHLSHTNEINHINLLNSILSLQPQSKTESKFRHTSHIPLAVFSALSFWLILWWKQMGWHLSAALLTAAVTAE